MENLLRLIGLNMPKYKFGDFDSNLRMHYIINFAFDIGMTVFIIIFAFTSHYTKAVLLFVLIMLITLGTHTYGLLQLLGGQVLYFEGECKSVNKNVKTVFKKQIFGKSSIEVKSENIIYDVMVSYNSQFKEGSLVRVYYLENTIYQKDEDTYSLPSPVCVIKIKNAQ